MLSGVERKVLEVIAEKRPKDEQGLFEAYLEVLKRLGDEHGYLFRYAHFLRLLKNVEAKTQRALEDLELVRKTGLFDPYGRLAFDVDALFERVKVVVTLHFGGIKGVVRNGDRAPAVVVTAPPEPADA